MAKHIPPNAGKGRGKGNVNKTTQAARELSSDLLARPAYRRSLQKRLDAGKAPHMEVLLHHYAYGKPKETVKVEEQPAELKVMILRSRADIQAINGPVDHDADVDSDDDE